METCNLAFMVNSSMIIIRPEREKKNRAQLQVGRRQSPIAEMILAVVNSLNN